MVRPMAAAAQALHPQTRRPKACTEQGFASSRAPTHYFRRPFGGSRRRSVLGLDHLAATGDSRRSRWRLKCSRGLTHKVGHKVGQILTLGRYTGLAGPGWAAGSPCALLVRTKMGWPASCAGGNEGRVLRAGRHCSLSTFHPRHLGCLQIATACRPGPRPRPSPRICAVPVCYGISLSACSLPASRSFPPQIARVTPQHRVDTSVYNLNL